MDRKFSILLVIFFLSFLVFFLFVIFNKPISKLTRAEVDLIPSSEKSFVFGWPLTVKADGKSKAEINVFIKSETDKFISGKQVVLYTTLGDVKTISGKSSDGGKTTFELTSTSPGIAELTANVDNIQLKRKLTIKFE